LRYSIIREKSSDGFNEFGDILKPLNAILFNDLKIKPIIRFMTVFHEPVKKSPPFPRKKFRLVSPLFIIIGDSTAFFNDLSILFQQITKGQLLFLREGGFVLE